MKKYTFVKIGVMSYAKFCMYLLGLIYGVIGLITGISMFITGEGFAIALITFLGFLIGGIVGGFVGVLIIGTLMNRILKLTGGIEMYFEE